jgi:hypothetical protein
VAAKCTHNKIIALASRHVTRPLAIPDQQTVQRFVTFAKHIIDTDPLFRPLEDSAHRHEPDYLDKFIRSRPFDR